MGQLCLAGLGGPVGASGVSLAVDVQALSATQPVSGSWTSWGSIPIQQAPESSLLGLNCQSSQPSAAEQQAERQSEADRSPMPARRRPLQRMPVRLIGKSDAGQLPDDAL